VIEDWRIPVSSRQHQQRRALQRNAARRIEIAPAGRKGTEGARRGDERADPAATAAGVPEVPEVLEVEAGKRLLLRCGQSSIELLANGKIVIRGVDIVSRGTRSNRVRGAIITLN
jgi:hypothetical protein